MLLIQYLLMPRGGKREGAGRRTDWSTSETRTIRVPVGLADRLMEIAKRLDKGELIEFVADSKKETVTNSIKVILQKWRTQSDDALLTSPKSPRWDRARKLLNELERVANEEVNLPIDKSATKPEPLTSLKTEEENVTESKEIQIDAESKAEILDVPEVFMALPPLPLLEEATSLLALEKEIEIVSESKKHSVAENEIVSESFQLKSSLNDSETISKLFTAAGLGEIFGVSDTAIRRWRDAGNLEKKTRERDPKRRGYGYLKEKNKYYQLPEDASVEQKLINIPPA